MLNNAILSLLTMSGKRKPWPCITRNFWKHFLCNIVRHNIQLLEQGLKNTFKKKKKKIVLLLKLDYLTLKIKFKKLKKNKKINCLAYLKKITFFLVLLLFHI